MAEGVDAHSGHALDISQACTLVVDCELENSVLVGQLDSGGKGADSALVVDGNLIQSLADVGVQHDQLQLNIVRREGVPFTVVVFGDRDGVGLSHKRDGEISSCPVSKTSIFHFVPLSVNNAGE